jgi:hypothetical protein
MGRHRSESTEVWYARAVHDLRVALAEEEAHWLRLVEGKSTADEHLPALDAAYMDAVERVDRAQYELFDAVQTREKEQQR